jgi:GTP-binding protein
MPGPLKLEFVLSAPGIAELPASPAEVTFVGRSNVGKSSLINALAGRKSLAETSKTPGRTQLLNCYRLDGGATVVDCPGYGYAKASKTARASMDAMVERYLREREPLDRVLVLVDGEVGPTKLDVAMLGWLRAHDRVHTVVATKHDKVKAAQRERRKRDLAAGCDLARGDIVWVSATTGVNIDHLRDLIRGWLTPT